MTVKEFKEWKVENRGNFRALYDLAKSEGISSNDWAKGSSTDWNTYANALEEKINFHGVSLLVHLNLDIEDDDSLDVDDLVDKLYNNGTLTKLISNELKEIKSYERFGDRMGRLLTADYNYY